MRTLPGTAAEILDDEARAVLCPDKVNTEQWLEVHRVAHGVGLRSNVTIMFGAVEQPRHWARHLVRTRDAAEERPAASPSSCRSPSCTWRRRSTCSASRAGARRSARRSSCTPSDASPITAAIDNIQASWVKMGIEGAQQLLVAGCNDLGGTLMDENISRAAGASHGQRMEEADFRSLAESVGRHLEQRTTLYGRVVPVVT